MSGNQGTNGGQPPNRWLQALLLVLLLAAARPGTALPPGLSLAQTHHTAWTTKEGAPADIWALAQSPDGFLLLGTGSGLYRFDGITFERVSASNQPELAFRDITALLALPSGELWIGYYVGGVSKLQNSVLTNYSTAEGLPSGWITSFARESDGTIWVAAREGLGRFSAGHWKTVSSDWSFRGHSAHWVLLDRQGTLWVAGGETVTFLPHGAHKFVDTGIRSGYDSTLALASDGIVWLGGQSVAPRPLQPRELPAEHDEPRPRLDPVKRMLFDQDGSLWATDSLRGGLYRVTQQNPTTHSRTSRTVGAAEIFTEAEGLTSDVAVPVLEDREGNIWVRTNLGLNRFRATPFVWEWRVPMSRTGYSLAATSNGAVLIASGAQLFAAYGSHCDLLTRLPTLIRSLYLEPGGSLWLGTPAGLVKRVDNNLTSLPLPAPPQPIQYQYAHSITADDSQGLLVSVVGRGLMRMRNGRWNVAGSEVSLPDAAPTALWTDADRQQWLGYSDGTVALRTRTGVRTFGTDQGLRVGPITVIGGTHTEIFVAGESGLARFDGRRFSSLSASRSDAFGGITGIVVRPNGDIWLNGSHGVVHMRSEALNNAYHHPVAKLLYDLFDIQDGLPGYALQGEDSTAIAGTDGRLWFATNHGVAWIDPEQLSRNRIPPQVVIRSVLADQSTYHAGSIELPKGARSVRIDYTALNLGTPERVRFRYKLEGADNTWRDAGNERAVRYASLRPGHYSFQVIASNGDGVWNDAGATVAFVLRPVFYQTSWFLALVSGACLGILWILLLARLRQVTQRVRKRLEQRLEDRLNERTRIARELHDSLLQGFQGLMFRLQAVRELLPQRPGTAAESLDAALKMGDEAPRDLNPHVRDDVYSIVREAVRNAYQHARATRIETDVTFGETDLSIRVRDDGIGVDPDILAHGQRADHWGLPGMRERGQTVGGCLKVWSEKNAGTEVELRIPARIAYTRPPGSTLGLNLGRWRRGHEGAFSPRRDQVSRP